MPRKPKAPDDLRIAKIEVPLTVDEKEAIASAARREGVSAAAFLRSTALERAGKSSDK